MAWNIVYLNNLEKWLNGLNKSQLKSLAKEIRLLELCGNQLRLPHSRSLGSGLFELRERAYGLRVYYIFDKNEVITVLQAGDKTTQARDIKKAREMLKQYRENQP